MSRIKVTMVEVMSSQSSEEFSQESYVPTQVQEEDHEEVVEGLKNRVSKLTVYQKRKKSEEHIKECIKEERKTMWVYMKDKEELYCKGPYSIHYYTCPYCERDINAYKQYLQEKNIKLNF